VVQNIDGMLVIVGVELAVVQSLLERGLSGIAGSIDPAPRSTSMATPTTASRMRSLVKYGTRSSGIDGSADSTMKRPPRTLVTWLRAPSDISTARTRAWSPPTRACETLRVPVSWPAAGDVLTPVLGVRGPAARTGGRNFPFPFFLPLRLTGQV